MCIALIKLSKSFIGFKSQLREDRNKKQKIAFNRHKVG